MKKSIFIIAGLILTACSPQVTALPTMTLPPTVTPTSTATATPSPTLTPSPEPTPTPLSPEEIAAEDFANYHLDASDYKFAYDADGHYQGWDSSGKIIYQDERWSPDMAEKLAESSGSCFSTEFIPAFPGANFVDYDKNSEAQKAFILFKSEMIDLAFDSKLLEVEDGYDKDNHSIFAVFLKIKGATNCWGVFVGRLQDSIVHPRDLIWLIEDGTVKAIPVF